MCQLPFSLSLPAWKTLRARPTFPSPPADNIPGTRPTLVLAVTEQGSVTALGTLPVKPTS